MFQRIFLSAILAGLISGMLVTALHQITTVPIITEAEKYESGEIKKTASLNKPHPYLIYVHGGQDKAHAEAQEWGPADGLERTVYTALTTILTAIGFALLLTAGFALSKQTINGRTGVIWGIAGFAAIALAPGVGLPPELPGSEAADLVSRQIWWVGTVSATIVAIVLLLFTNQWIYRLLGVALILVPHAIGAPHPDHFGGQAPPELASHFASASLACNFVLWSLIGWFSGTFYQRFEH